MERSTFAHDGDNADHVDKVAATPPSAGSHESMSDKEKDAMGEKVARTTSSEVPQYRDEEGRDDTIHVDTAEDIVTTVIAVEDDPTLNPWTFRVFFIGM